MYREASKSLMADTAKSKTSRRAWVDEGDAEIQKETPSFLRGSHTTPGWAVSDDRRRTEADDGDEAVHQARAAESLARKRFRSEDLDSLLSRTEPLLSSRHDRQHSAAPVVSSVVPLPRDTAHTLHWHRNGQLLLVGGNRHVYTFHVAGGFVEQLSKVSVGQRLAITALSDGGEEVVVATHQAYAPQLLSIATEKLVPLKFLDTRDTAVHRNGRVDNGRQELFISKIVCQPNDGGQRGVAVACGATLSFASLASGSVVGRITTDVAIRDVCYMSNTEVAVAAGNRVLVYDVRRTARFLRDMSGEGTMDITRFAYHKVGGSAAQTLAIGSSSGIVSVYDSSSVSPGQVKSDTALSKLKIMRELKQLVTPISDICFGTNSNGETVLAFSSRGQKGGFRVAPLPELHVVPSFPAVSSRHGFVQCMEIAPTVPLLSVGERQKVTNYAL